MGHDEGRRCACVAEHRPGVLELTEHHIRPLSMGGQTTPENLVWLCPTALANTHEILREIVRRGGPLTWGQAQALWHEPLNRYAYALAHEGWRRATGDT